MEIQTFDATWVKKYFSKGGRPQITWTRQPATQITDMSVTGNQVWWPEAAILPGGEQVPRWRYFGSLMVFNAIASFQSQAPVLYYLSWEQPCIELTMADYDWRFPGRPLPAQPNLGWTTEEIQRAWDARL